MGYGVWGVDAISAPIQSIRRGGGLCGPDCDAQEKICLRFLPCLSAKVLKIYDTYTVATGSMCLSHDPLGISNAPNAKHAMLI